MVKSGLSSTWMSSQVSDPLEAQVRSFWSTWWSSHVSLIHLKTKSRISDPLEGQVRSFWSIWWSSQVSLIHLKAKSSLSDPLHADIAHYLAQTFGDQTVSVTIATNIALSVSVETHLIERVTMSMAGKGFKYHNNQVKKKQSILFEKC